MIYIATLQFLNFTFNGVHIMKRLKNEKYKKRKKDIRRI